MSSAVISFGSIVKLMIVPLATVAGAVVGAVGGYVVEGRRAQSAMDVQNIQSSERTFIEILKVSHDDPGRMNQLLRIAIENGLMQYVDQNSFARTITENPERVPKSFLCSHVWCIFYKRIDQIKRVYASLGYYNGKFDNQLTDEFRDATYRFQKDHNLLADGILGPQTFEEVERKAEEIGMPISPI